ncbi:MAG: carbohydrate-binding family V/XII [Gemmatimonadota bacterium]
MVGALGWMAAASSAAAQDSTDGWPREIVTDTARIVIYQPQVDSLKGDVVFSRSAISIEARPKGDPVFGATWSSARMTTDRDANTVHLHDIDVLRVRFPAADSARQEELAELIEKVAATWDLTTSLETIKTSLAAAQEERGTAADLKTEPPAIVLARSPTVLVVFDGTPQLRPLANTSYQRVINTPYAVVYDPGTRVYYLTGARHWYRASAATGPYTSIPAPPEAIAHLVPPDTAAADTESGAAPSIMTATTPTELLATDGDPQFSPISGTDLLYVTNTQGDLFKDIGSQNYFVLLSGRWYASRTLAGPWTFTAPDALPGGFARIPPDSPKGNVLVSVAGTSQADDAVADASVPQTAAINRKDATLDVAYDGEPRFEDVTGTRVSYAVNTSTSVLRINGLYYACSDAVWYVANSATGPWAVSDSVPDEVQSIPPSSPMYNVKYVQVYESTPDVVYVGYTPGYLGIYPYYGTVVYGTGWDYPPYYGPAYFYPRPYTWGFHAHYWPYWGWGYGDRWSRGFMREGDRWGGYYRPPGYRGGYYGGGWYGPGGYRPPRPRPPVNVADRPYRQRPAVYRPANIYNRPEIRPAVNTRPAPRNRQPGVSAGRNNVFVDRDGNVNRRTNTGWETREGNQWKPSSRPAIQPRNPNLRPTTRPGPAVNPGTTRPQPQVNPGTARPQPQVNPGTTRPQPQVNPGTARPQPQVNPGTSRPATRPSDADARKDQLEREYQARQRSAEQSRPQPPPQARPAERPQSRPADRPQARPAERPQSRPSPPPRSSPSPRRPRNR